jgi:rubrerythrin
MSVQEALDLAMEAETKAYEFFDQALPQIEDSEVRELFAELREEEIEHINLVKKVMDAVEQDSDFDPEDFVDEPHAL